MFRFELSVLFIFVFGTLRISGTNTRVASTHGEDLRFFTCVYMYVLEREYDVESIQVNNVSER